MRESTCKECCKNFKILAKRGSQLYCSRECAVSYRNRHPREYKTTAVLRSRSPEAFIRQLIRKKSLRLEIPVEYYLELYKQQEGLCALSGRQMTYTLGEGVVPTNISVDRIDPSKGYTVGNIQLVCRQANMMKYVGTVEELISWCVDILANRKK